MLMSIYYIRGMVSAMSGDGLGNLLIILMMLIIYSLYAVFYLFSTVKTLTNNEIRLTILIYAISILPYVTMVIWTIFL